MNGLCGNCGAVHPLGTPCRVTGLTAFRDMLQATAPRTPDYFSTPKPAPRRQEPDNWSWGSSNSSDSDSSGTSYTPSAPSSGSGGGDSDGSDIGIGLLFVGGLAGIGIAFLMAAGENNTQKSAPPRPQPAPITDSPQAQAHVQRLPTPAENPYHQDKVPYLKNDMIIYESDRNDIGAVLIEQAGYLTIAELVNEGPAHKAGLKKGDIISFINGYIYGAAFNNEERRKQLLIYITGTESSEVLLEITRGSERFEISVPKIRYAQNSSYQIANSTYPLLISDDQGTKRPQSDSFETVASTVNIPVEVNSQPIASIAVEPDNPSKKTKTKKPTPAFSEAVSVANIAPAEPIVPTVRPVSGQRDFYIVSGNGLNLRESASTQSASLGVLDGGSCVQFKANIPQSDFVKVDIITADRVEMSGFVHEDHIRRANTAQNQGCVAVFQ